MRAKIFLIIGAVIQLGLFGGMLILMTTVNPKKVKSKPTTEKTDAKPERRAMYAAAATTAITTNNKVVATTITTVATTTSATKSTSTKPPAQFRSRVVEPSLQRMPYNKPKNFDSKIPHLSQSSSASKPILPSMIELPIPLSNIHGKDTISIVSPKNLTDISLVELLGPSEACNETACVYRLVQVPTGRSGDVDDFIRQNKYRRLIPPLHPVKGFRRSLPGNNHNELDKDSIMLKFLGIDPDGAPLIEINVGSHLAVANSLTSGEASMIKLLPYKIPVKQEHHNYTRNLSEEAQNNIPGHVSLIPRLNVTVKYNDKKTIHDVSHNKTQNNKTTVNENEEKHELSENFYKEVMEEITKHISTKVYVDKFVEHVQDSIEECKEIKEKHDGNTEVSINTREVNINESMTVNNDRNDKHDQKNADYDRDFGGAEDLQNRTMAEFVSNMDFFTETITFTSYLKNLNDDRTEYYTELPKNYMDIENYREKKEMNPLAESTKSEINPLTESTKPEINSLTKSTITETNKPLTESTNTEINPLTESTKTDIYSRDESTKTEINSLTESTITEINYLTESTKTIMNAITESPKTEMNPFLTESTITEINHLTESTKTVMNPVTESTKAEMNPFNKSTKTEINPLTKSTEIYSINSFNESLTYNTSMDSINLETIDISEKQKNINISISVNA